jgi:hypothetical protein
MRSKKSFIAAAMFAVCLLANNAKADQGDVDQAVAIIENFQKIPEHAISTTVLRGAKGLAIMTVTKAGFVVAGRGGKALSSREPAKDGAVLQRSARAAQVSDFRQECRFRRSCWFSIHRPRCRPFIKTATLPSAVT